MESITNIQEEELAIGFVYGGVLYAKKYPLNVLRTDSLTDILHKAQVSLAFAEKKK